MKNFYLIFMLVCFMGGMLLSAKAEEKEPLIIEMLTNVVKRKCYMVKMWSRLMLVKQSHGHQTQRS